MNEWKPIDTAPTDGSTIVVFVPSIHEGLAGNVRLAHFEHRVTTVNTLIVDERTGWREVTSTDINYVLRNPTHWMPMPDPPQEPKP